jgi:formylglycine-generating enzyme required for sulfatase activity
VKSGTSRDDGNPTGGGAGLPSLSGLFDAADGDEGEDVLAKGTSIGRYLVLERLGAGAMGVVYAAYDPELDRKIALKLLSRQEGRGGDKARRQQRLVREAKAIAKLSHPNVVGIFDVGVHEGQVFMAMEYLGGGTLRDWMNAKKRPWREIVKMFIEVGQGLAAAHAEGLIHRDFKPDNVLLDKAGKPKVADFGLVRLRSAAFEVATADEAESAVPPEPPAPDLPIAQTALAPLTRTGSLAGTPAYMAPEQFLGKPIDARTDQFAFCVALHEALYGERPFAGDTVMALAGAVARGRMTDPPRDSDVPGWIRRHVQRGLAPDPAQRHEGFDGLLTALARDPVAQLRRRVGIGAVALMVVAAIAFVQRRGERRRMEFERQISERVAEATKAHARAGQLTERATHLRAKAIAAYDGRRRQEGERLWADAKKVFVDAEREWERADRSLQATYDLDRQRTSVRDKLSEVLFGRMLLDELRFRKQATLDHLERFRSLDPHGRFLQRWNAPGVVELTASAGPTKVRVEAAIMDGSGRSAYEPRGAPKDVPAVLTLEPGSYRLVASSPGRAPVSFPLLVARGSRTALTLELPDANAVPTGFVFVPEGDSFFGDHDETLRTSFLDAVPIHSVHVKAFAIARHETSVAQWIAFLESPEGRATEDFLPSGKDPSGGSVRLRKEGARWTYHFNPWSRAYRLPQGVPVRYEGRARSAVNAWEDLPVTGVSPRAAEEFAAWLRKTKRVSGARLCTEHEWERAARGADARIFPHGDTLAAVDANFDASHAHSPELFGLDAVGSHPASDSPFGLSDLAGNAIEIARSSLGPEKYVIRGGSYYQDANTARVTNRAVITPMTRGQSVGVRLCADVRELPSARAAR